MNTNALSTGQAGSTLSDELTADAALNAAASPPSEEIMGLHRMALVLLQSPALPPRVLQWLTAMPARALQWLWTVADPSPAAGPQNPADTFAEACSALSMMPIDSAELSCPDVVDRLDRLLQIIRHKWRFVPPGLLAKMLLMLPAAGPPDRLLQLQLHHVADWGGVRDRKMSSAPRREWAIFVAAAMKFRHHDEIALRMRPRKWQHPLANLRVSGFVLTPVCSTGHLVDVQGHQGALCNSKVADACERGTEAWWLVRSALGVPFPANCMPVDAAVSLLANKDGSWAVGHVLAPPHCKHAAMQVARSLAAQAEINLRLHETGRMAMPNPNDLPGVRAALETLMAQQPGAQH